VDALEGEVIIVMGDDGQKQTGTAVRDVGRKYRLAVTLNEKQRNKYVISILPASTRRRLVPSVELLPRLLQVMVVLIF
jgi:hypothetical protein